MGLGGGGGGGGRSGKRKKSSFVVVALSKRERQREREREREKPYLCRRVPPRRRALVQKSMRGRYTRKESGARVPGELQQKEQRERRSWKKKRHHYESSSFNGVVDDNNVDSLGQLEYVRAYDFKIKRPEMSSETLEVSLNKNKEKKDREWRRREPNKCVEQAPASR